MTRKYTNNFQLALNNENFIIDGASILAQDPNLKVRPERGYKLVKNTWGRPCAELITYGYQRPGKTESWSEVDHILNKRGDELIINLLYSHEEPTLFGITPTGDKEEIPYKITWGDKITFGYNTSLLPSENLESIRVEYTRGGIIITPEYYEDGRGYLYRIKEKEGEIKALKAKRSSLLKYNKKLEAAKAANAILIKNASIHDIFYTCGGDDGIEYLRKSNIIWDSSREDDPDYLNNNEGYIVLTDINKQNPGESLGFYTGKHSRRGYCNPHYNTLNVWANF